MFVAYLALFAVSLAPCVTSVANGMQRLPAIGVRGPEPASHELVATSTNPSNISLQQEEVFYMGDATNPSNPLAQLTGMANSPDTQLLSTERFADMIKHMTCAADSVQVQFASPTSFHAAQAAWTWVNQGTSRRIILVTGGDGCSTTPKSTQGTPSMQQGESYAVNHITFSPSSLSATLTGNTAPLGQLLDGHWKLQGSSSGIFGSNLNRRDGTDQISLAHVQSIPNLFNHKVAGPVNVSLDGTLTSQGSLHWEIDVPGIDIVQAKLTITTKGVSFTLKPQLSLSGSVDAIAPVSINLPSIPLGTGLEGPLGTKIGVFLNIGAQASLGTVKAEVDASIDIELALSDGTLVISGEDKPTADGFKPTFSVHSPEVKGQVSLVSSVGPTIGLVLQASVFGSGLEGGIQLEAPKAQMTLTAKADSAGVCDTDHSVGAEIDVDVGAELSAIYAIGELKDGSKSSLKIYATSTPVFSTCTGFGPTVNTASPTHSPTTTNVQTPSPTTLLTTTNPAGRIVSAICQALKEKGSTCANGQTAAQNAQAGTSPIHRSPAPTTASPAS